MLFCRNALLLVALVCGSAGASDVVGTWIVVPDPGQLDSTIVVTRQAGSLTGTWQHAFGVTDFALKAIEEDGESLSMRLILPAEASATFPHFLKGARKGNEMRLTVLDGAGRNLHLVLNAFRAAPRQLAERSAAVPSNIHVKKLPLPALRDLPDNGLARTPPMGWNNWNHFGDAIDDRTVREIADTLVSTGLRDAGYRYVIIDVGWQGYRDSGGELHSNVKFPDMQRLGEFLHSKGLKFGLYSSPGPRDCLNRVGSHGYEDQDAKTFARWGVDYVKYDACSATSVYHTEAEGQALYQKMGEALRATGRPIVYSLSGFGGDGRLGRKVGGNLWRTGGDISDQWVTMSALGFDQSGSAASAGPGGWNDPDMLEIGNGGMTVDEYRTQMTLWSMLAAPLILGNDIRCMSSDIRSILLNSEVIAVDQDTLGRQGYPAIKRELVEVWAKPLAGGAMAVALFNRGELASVARFRWSDLGLSGNLTVRDLWQRSDAPITADGYETTLSPHGSALLRVAPLP
jgi:alpha-galactosidase